MERVFQVSLKWFWQTTCISGSWYLLISSFAEIVWGSVNVYWDYYRTSQLFADDYVHLAITKLEQRHAVKCFTAKHEKAGIISVPLRPRSL